MIVNTKIRRRKGSQSIRIPSEFALPDSVKEVMTDDGLIITPVKPLKSWKEFFERGPWVSADFLSERVDPP